MNRSSGFRSALGFVVLLGIVSLFADANYEGGRSVAGPYLLVLGITPAILGIASGAIDFFQYLGRLIAGWWVGRSGHSWRVLTLGYMLNLFALPALVFTHQLIGALGLLFLERLGRGIRNPVKNNLLAQAGDELGHGRVFGLYEILDQTGAVLGPLFVGFWLLRHSLRMTFATLAIPAVLSMLWLWVAYRYRPQSASEAAGSGSDAQPSGNDRTRIRRFRTWAALIAAASGTYIFIGYALIAHDHWTYAQVAGGFALAMAMDGIGGLFLGILYDRIGFRSVYAFPVSLAASIALIFWGQLWLVWLGIGIWGLQLGFAETVIPAMFGQIIPRGSRTRLFGSLGFLTGLSGLLGVGVMGVLYALNPAWTPVWSLALAAIAIFIMMRCGWLESSKSE
ncbi:MAG: MFS transporter [Gammaproteobacteria bacterium]